MRPDGLDESAEQNIVFFLSSLFFACGILRMGLKDDKMNNQAAARFTMKLEMVLKIKPENCPGGLIVIRNRWTYCL